MSPFFLESAVLLFCCVHQDALTQLRFKFARAVVTWRKRSEELAVHPGAKPKVITDREL